MTEAKCSLYLITPPQIDLKSFTSDFEAALEGGNVACAQLRLKDASDEEVRQATNVLMPIAQKFDVAFLINDSPDLARSTLPGVGTTEYAACALDARAAPP